MGNASVVSRELYDDAEEENGRLRTIIRWCAARIPPADLPTLRAMFDDGAVPDATDELEADIATVQKLMLQLASQIEPVVSTRKVPKGWDVKTEALLEQARAYEPKNPLLRPTIKGVSNP